MDYTSLTLPQLIAAAEKSSAEAHNLGATLRAAQHSITNLEKDYKDARTQIEYLQSSNAAYIEANRESDHLNRAALAKKEELKGELKCARAAECKAVAVLEAMKNHNAELEAKCAVACAQADKFQSKHEAQVKARDALKELYDAALGTIQGVKNDAKKDRADRDEMFVKLSAAEKKIVDLQAQLGDVEAAIIKVVRRESAEVILKLEARNSQLAAEVITATNKCKQLEGQLDALETAKGDTANENLVAINIELREKLHKAQTAADIQAKTSAPELNAGAACAENFARHEAAIVKMCEQIHILQQAVFPASAPHDCKMFGLKK